MIKIICCHLYQVVLGRIVIFVFYTHVGQSVLHRLFELNSKFMSSKLLIRLLLLDHRGISLLFILTTRLFHLLTTIRFRLTTTLLLFLFGLNFLVEVLHKFRWINFLPTVGREISFNLLSVGGSIYLLIADHT